MFGLSLEEHLRVTGRKIAYPIELCVCALSVLAMDEEGLFRVAGGEYFTVHTGLFGVKSVVVKNT